MYVITELWYGIYGTIALLMYYVYVFCETNDAVTMDSLYAPQSDQLTIYSVLTEQYVLNKGL